MNYKEAVAEIEAIVAKLEENRLDIDELSAQVKRALELLAFCNFKLRATEQEVEKLLQEMQP